MIAALLLIIITLFIPPLGVLLVAGCGADFCINLLLTILGYFPGHIHAFYIEYIYYKRRDEARNGVYDARPAPGVYSDRVNNVGREHYVHAPEAVVPPPQQQQPQYQQGGPVNYGTVGGQQQQPVQQPPAYTK